MIPLSSCWYYQFVIVNLCYHFGGYPYTGVISKMSKELNHIVLDTLRNDEGSFQLNSVTTSGIERSKDH